MVPPSRTVSNRRSTGSTSFLDRHLGEVVGKRVLDLGCGHGWFSNELHRRGADVIGIDGSEALLDIGRARYPHVSFEQVDLLGFSLGGFITQVIAQEEPQLVRKIVLAGTGLFF